jgi:hypothetical protein
MAYTDVVSAAEARRVVALDAALRWAAEINGFDEDSYIDDAAVVAAAGKFEDFLLGTPDRVQPPPPVRRYWGLG